MTEPKVLHLKDWGATAMLSHAIERIPDTESCLVLFYEDGELKSLSSHIDHQSQDHRGAVDAGAIQRMAQIGWRPVAAEVPD